MVKPKVVAGAVIAVVVGMVFFPAVVNAVDTSTGTQTVENETVTAQSGEYVDLSGYQVEDGTVTVYGYNDTSASYETATSPDDYEVKFEPGELKANSSSTLIDDGENVKVTYDYKASNDTTTLIAGFIPVMIGVLLFFSLARKTMDMM